MAEVLSQKQIDELLGNIKSGDIDLKQIEEEKNQKKIKKYDFKSPKRITRDQIKLLDSIFQNFVRLFGLHLSSILRLSCEMELIQIEEQQYYEYSNALEDSVLMGMYEITNEDKIEGKNILIEMARPVSFCIMDRLMGGSGDGYGIERDYTDIELSLLEHVCKQISPILTNSWSNYIDANANYSHIETNSRLIQSIAPEDTVVIIVAEILINDLKGTINICLPANTIISISKAFDNKFSRNNKKYENAEDDLQRKSFIMSSLGDSPLNISAILGETEILLKDLLSLQVGDILSLDTLEEGKAIEVKVEDLPWFTGTMGVKKKKYAIKIDKVLQ